MQSLTELLVEVISKVQTPNVTIVFLARGGRFQGHIPPFQKGSKANYEFARLMSGRFRH